MKGLQIFLHSVRQVTGNLEGALRVSALPYLAQAVVGLVLVGSAGSIAGGVEAGNPVAALSGGNGLAMLVALAVAIGAGLWMAVAWHRYVLLGELPEGFIPVWKGARILAYFLRSLGYGVLIILAGAVWGAFVGYALSFIASWSVALFMLLVALLVQIPIAAAAFRLSAALPGAALGDERDFMAGWQATAGHTGDILVLSVFAIGAHVILALIGTTILSHIWVLLILWQFVTGWLVMMVSVSILTTLYGHYIEGRPLV